MTAQELLRHATSPTGMSWSPAGSGRWSRRACAMVRWPWASSGCSPTTSPSDGRSGVQAKAVEWIDAGTRAVVVLDPQRRVAAVFRAGEEARELEGDARLELADVVPGFAVPVGDLFV